jgi:protein regulator of cytokinesis 1
MEREEIHKLWQTLRYGLEQQENFAPYFEDNFTEESLTIHEKEVVRLKLEAEEAAHVLEIVARYEDRLRAIKELELATRDVDRYKAKGAPGRLLKEEKDRKLNARELPKIEAELTEALNQWEEEKKRPFLVYGEVYIDTMKIAASLAREGRENEKQLRVSFRTFLLFTIEQC